MPTTIQETKAASPTGLKRNARPALATKAAKPLAVALNECLDPKSPFQPVLVGHQDVEVSLSNGSAFVSYVDCKDAEWVNYRRLEAEADRPSPTRRGREMKHEQARQRRAQMRGKPLPNRLLFNLRRFANGKFTDEDFSAGLYEGEPGQYVEDTVGVRGSYPNDFWFVARGCCGDLRLRQWQNGAWHNPEIDRIDVTDSHTDRQMPAALLPWEDSSLIVLEPVDKAGLTTFVTLGKGRQPQLTLETDSRPPLHFATLLPNTLYVATSSYRGQLIVYVDAPARPVAEYRPLGNETVELIGIFPRSKNDVFVLVNRGESRESAVLHFDGRHWQRQTFPERKPFRGASLDAQGVLWVTCGDYDNAEPPLWYWNGNWHPTQLIARGSDRGEPELPTDFSTEGRFMVSDQHLYFSGAELDKWREVPLITKYDYSDCAIEWVQNDGREIWAKLKVQNREVLLRHGGAETIDVCDDATPERP